MKNLAPSILNRIFFLYYDGFRSMTVGKTLWKIILIKLLIMFGVLKLFFFPDFLNANFATDEERAAHVLDNISNLSIKQ